MQNGFPSPGAALIDAVPALDDERHYLKSVRAGSKNRPPKPHKSTAGTRRSGIFLPVQLDLGTGSRQLVGSEIERQHQLQPDAARSEQPGQPDDEVPDWVEPGRSRPPALGRGVTRLVPQPNPSKFA